MIWIENCCRCSPEWWKGNRLRLALSIVLEDWTLLTEHCGSHLLHRNCLSHFIPPCLALRHPWCYFSCRLSTVKVYSEPLLSNTHGCLQYGALSWTLLVFMKEGKQWWSQKHSLSLFVCGCSPHHFPTAQNLPGELRLRGLNWDLRGGGSVRVC